MDLWLTYFRIQDEQEQDRREFVNAHMEAGIPRDVANRLYEEEREQLVEFTA